MAGEGRGFPLSVVQIDGHNKGEVGEALKEKKETRIFRVEPSIGKKDTTVSEDAIRELRQEWN